MYYTQQTKQVQIPLFYWQAGPIYEALFSLVYIHTSTYLLLNILDGVLFTKKTLFFFCLNIFALSTAVKELDNDFAKLAREIPRPKQRTGDDDDDDMAGGLC